MKKRVLAKLIKAEGEREDNLGLMTRADIMLRDMKVAEKIGRTFGDYVKVREERLKNQVLSRIENQELSQKENFFTKVIMPQNKK